MLSFRKPAVGLGPSPAMALDSPGFGPRRRLEMQSWLGDLADHDRIPHREDRAGNLTHRQSRTNLSVDHPASLAREQ